MTVSMGILGFAHGHVNAYCAQWLKRPELGVKLVAGWDHDAARLDKAAADYGIAAFANTQDLLSRADVQAVVVSAETSLHAELVEQAAAAGKIIILQKPMALTMAEGDRIVAAVQRYNVPFTMAWQMRVDPQNIEIKQLLQSGQLGKIFMVRRRHALGTHLWDNFRRYVARQARAEPRHLGRRRGPRHRLYPLAAGRARDGDRRDGHAARSPRAHG